MSLRNFSFVRYAVYDDLKNFIKNSEEIVTLKEKFENEFSEERVWYSNKSQVNSDEARADSAWFETSFISNTDEKIWAKFVLNRKPNSQKWYMDTFLIESEVNKSIISINHFVIGEIIFNDSVKGYEFLENLKNEVQPEDWKYTDFKSPINYPILKSYIEHTYDRLKNENKILISNDKTQVLFNTGLLDKDFLLDVYVLCTIIRIKIFGKEVDFPSNPEIYLEDNVYILRSFSGQIPKLAKYFSNIDQVVFNPDLDINMNWKHIFIEREDRIPYEIKEGSISVKEIVKSFRGNEENIKKLAKRNYKMVVPQFYDGEIQFLMPIYLGTEFSGKPSFALVLALDESKTLYLGTTILTVEMAYQNARLIAKPDNPWLVSGLG